MKIVNGFDLIHYAQRNHHILPAFNTTNLEMTYAIAKGLSNAGFPGYIQISSSNLKLSNPDIIAEITKNALINVDVPIALHLDHGKSFEDVKACVKAGFSSIMIDASHLPYEDNIKEVRRTVEYCHFYGIPVEAELGALSGKEDETIHESGNKTNSDLVDDYINRTGCDLLAVSVGNVHGLSLQPNIDLMLLKKISELSPISLVMHGGSGITADVISVAKAYHIIKINYGAVLRKEFIKTFGLAYEKDNNEHDIIHLSFEAVLNISNKVSKIVTMINQ